MTVDRQIAIGHTNSTLSHKRCSLFSQTSDYALRAVAHLASIHEGMSTIPKMSESIQVNPPYLRKVIDKLREAEIVDSQRGTGGGVFLLIDPNKLTILDVLNAVDPLQRIEKCTLGLPGHLKLCPLHSELDAAISQIEELLGNRTIGELLSLRRSSARCSFPNVEDLYQL